MDEKHIAKLIKELIGNQSQRAFAEKAGVLDMSLSRWLNGTKINLVDFDKLCKAAGRKIHEVLNVEGVTESLQKDFSVPEEYTLSVKELLKELLELQQENNVNGQSDNFIKLMTRHIRETKETLRATKIRPDRWLSITDFTEKITTDSEIKLIIPSEKFKENLSRYSVVFQLITGQKTYFCSYTTKGGGTTWSYLRKMAHQFMASKLTSSSIKGVMPSPADWQSLLNKQYEGDLIEGEGICYEDKNATFNAFIDLVLAYFKENNYSE